MNGPTCDDIRDLLPDRVHGTLEPEVEVAVREHVSSCPECAEEETLLRRLLASRPEPPTGLEARIRGRVREEAIGVEAEGSPDGVSEVIPLFRRRRWAPSWALSAAAVVILSLGVGVIWNGEEIPEIGQDPIQVAAEEPAPEAWLWDDGIVAGAPVYDGLTDAELEALIQELEG